MELPNLEVNFSANCGCTFTETFWIENLTALAPTTTPTIPSQISAVAISFHTISGKRPVKFCEHHMRLYDPYIPR